MSTNGGKAEAREWWISESPFRATTRYGGFAEYRCFSDEMKTPETTVHVIEKSAYDALTQELTQVRSELEELRSQPITIAHMKSCERNIVLHEQLEIALEALGCVRSHDYGKADVFLTMRNTVDAALEALK